MESSQLRFTWAMTNLVKMSKIISSNNFFRFKQQEFGQHLPTRQWRWEATLKFEQTFRQRWLDQTIEALRKNQTCPSSTDLKKGEWERVHGFLASDLASRLPASHLASLWRAGHGWDRQRETFGSIQSIWSYYVWVIGNLHYHFTQLYIGSWWEVDNPGGDDHPLQWA